MSVRLHIEALAHGGDAIARHEGRVVFVPLAVPGDEVEAELEGGDPPRARLVRVTSASTSRREPGCPHFARCGGCQWLHVAPADQLSAKEGFFYGALERIGGIGRDALARANPIVAAASPLRYRRRATFHLQGGRIGFRARASHDLVEIDQCLLLDGRLEQALLALREALRSKPLAKCTDVALACDEGRVGAAFFTSTSNPAVLQRAEELMRRARLDGAVVVPEGGGARLLGKPLLSSAAPLSRVTLHARPDLFAQADADTNEQLVGEAMRLMGEGGEVLELFGGAGNFTFAAAARSRQVLSIEIASDSLELARRSAREANVANVKFIVGDALKVAAGLAKEGRRFDTLLLDPPRTGARGIGAVARDCGARRVVYVSCNPATLARDARELVECGFRPTEATPVDMFPQTFHVEGVLALERG